jgi:hypothetical protein
MPDTVRVKFTLMVEVSPQPAAQGFTPPASAIVAAEAELTGDTVASPQAALSAAMAAMGSFGTDLSGTLPQPSQDAMEALIDGAFAE